MTEENSKSRKIFPRNLTARAAYQVAGNPVTTRLESGVGNCYPGLEIHLPALDRRFFPGLLFTFVDLSDNYPPYTEPQRRGAKLIYVDLTDPEIASGNPDAAEYEDLSGAKGTALSTGIWYLHSVRQDGKEIFMYEYSEDGSRTPLQGLAVWRLVSSLKPGALTIKLIRRDGDPQLNTQPEIELKGWRRVYVDPKTGVLTSAYSPGELGQSLCSPWTHDFRDCACHYWASNHPDVVKGAIFPGEEVLPDGESRNPIKANTPLDWLREDRSPAGAVAAMNTIDKNRPFQFDHYQINQRWEELNIVLQNYEIAEVYNPLERDPTPQPFSSPQELVKELEEKLAPLEMVLALEYLYARYSILDPAEVPADRWPTLKSDVSFIRHFLMLVAASEMTHLRWVNQLLWGLYNAPGLGLPPDGYRPILTPAKEIPTIRADKEKTPGSPAQQVRPRQLRPLFPETLDDFIAVEAPSGFIDGAYARVVATLRQKEYPDHLYELAVRIDSNGMEHYSRFRDIKKALEVYQSAEPKYPYLRNVTIGTPEQAKAALAQYGGVILPHLRDAYMDFSNDEFEQGGTVTQVARTAMTQLNQIADQLAAEGIGVPFWF